MCAAYAASAAKAAQGPITICGRVPRAHHVLIDIPCCGICPDIHQARDEWGGSAFPIVPGHEITAVVSRVGRKFTKFKVGSTARLHANTVLWRLVTLNDGYALRFSQFVVAEMSDPLPKSHGKRWEWKQNPDVVNLKESIDYKII